MRILVPIDATPQSEAALTEAVRLIVATSGSIVLVSFGEVGRTSTQADEARAALGRRLDEIAARLAPLPVETRVELAGDPVQGILDVAIEVAADRIVMSTEQAESWDGLTEQRHVPEAVPSDAEAPVRVFRIRKIDVD